MPAKRYQLLRPTIYMQSNCPSHAFQEASTLTTHHKYAVKLPFPCLPRGINSYDPPYICSQTALPMLFKRHQLLRPTKNMQSNCLSHACQEVSTLTTHHIYAVKLPFPCFSRGINSYDPPKICSQTAFPMLAKRCQLLRPT